MTKTIKVVLANKNAHTCTVHHLMIGSQINVFNNTAKLKTYK